MNRDSRQDSDLDRLIRQAQAGDVPAFEQLYRKHVSGVYGLCLKLVADTVQAEILTQDVFVRAWQKLGTYQGRGDFGGWLHRVAVNVVREERRREARRNRLIQPHARTGAGEGYGQGMVNQDQITSELTGTTAAPDAAVDRIDLDRAIAALPIGARLAFVLHDVMGYPHAEIASMTGSAVGTVKAQLHRARSLLRKALTDATAHENPSAKRESSQ